MHGLFLLFCERCFYLVVKIILEKQHVQHPSVYCTFQTKKLASVRHNQTFVIMI